MIGARVLKTALAVTLAILTARLLHLDTPQFAGIVSVLAVQPSLYRSLRFGLQHTLSASFAALVGAFVMDHVGNAFWVIGLVALLMMVVHVKLKITNSLLLSVVVAVNTMGATSPHLGSVALNQIALVLIGVGYGTLINLFPRPFHQERAGVLLTQAEGMIRALLYYMQLELLEGRITPYLKMRQQINEVRVYIERGKEISGLINEDEKYRINPRKSPMQLFQSLETMAERVRDVSKELQKVDLAHPELCEVADYLYMVLQAQENSLTQNHGELIEMEHILEEKRNRLWQEREITNDFQTRLAIYNLYGYLREYVREFLHVMEQDLATKLISDQEGTSAQKTDAG